MDRVAAAASPDDSGADLLDEAWSGIEPPVARRLMVAAVGAFAARGYHATTTRDIAGRAGLSPAGVYVHFRSKEDLLYRISLLGHQQSLRVIRAAAASTDDPVARLRAVVADFTAWHARFHTAARVVQYELDALTEEHRAEIAVLRRQVDGVVRDTLEYGTARGALAVPDVPGGALALLSLAIDVARWYRPGPRVPEDVGRLYADLAVRMFRAAPS